MNDRLRDSLKHDGHQAAGDGRGDAVDFLDASDGMTKLVPGPADDDVESTQYLESQSLPYIPDFVCKAVLERRLFLPGAELRHANCLPSMSDAHIFCRECSTSRIVNVFLCRYQFIFPEMASANRWNLFLGRCPGCRRVYFDCHLLTACEIKQKAGVGESRPEWEDLG